MVPGVRAPQEDSSPSPRDWRAHSGYHSRATRLRHGLHVTSPAGALLDLGVGDIALAGQHPGVVGGPDRIVELVELPAVGRFFGRLVAGVVGVVARVVEALGFAVIHGDPIPG